MSNEIQTYLSFANLQMAAEARLDLFENQASVAALTFGNNRSSRFTEVQATDFASKYTVVAHQANTSTGFSGTLFRENATGELTLSFRSTEFADDSVRDNQATNGMEINTFGWAFGQIADMQNWFNGLRANNQIPQGVKFNVTGYSLGGHLAAAFNLLHPTDVAATYTFNAAGVGDLVSGANLYSVVNTFERQRTNTSGQEIVFGNAQLHAKYEYARIKLKGCKKHSCSRNILLGYRTKKHMQTCGQGGQHV